MKPAERGFLLSKESYAQHLAANAVDPPEHRADLGNSQPGDGSKYLGRGLIQTVGRATYYSTSPPQLVVTECKPPPRRRRGSCVL